MSLWDSLLAGIGQLIPAADKASAPIVKVGAKTITAGQARAGVAALKAFKIDDLDKAVVARFAILPDDEAVADDDLAFLASVGVPAADEVKLAVDFLEILVPWLVANNLAHPINNPVVDAQTKASAETHGFNEGR